MKRRDYLGRRKRGVHFRVKKDASTRTWGLKENDNNWVWLWVWKWRDGDRKCDWEIAGTEYRKSQSLDLILQGALGQGTLWKWSSKTRGPEPCSALVCIRVVVITCLYCSTCLVGGCAATVKGSPWQCMCIVWMELYYPVCSCQWVGHGMAWAALLLLPWEVL